VRYTASARGVNMWSDAVQNEPTTVGVLSARITVGVSSLPRDQWCACFPGEAESWDYYAACEAAPPKGVGVAAACVEDEHGLLAAAPLFFLSYRLDTPLQGPLRRFGDALVRAFPALMEWRLIGVGSPFADTCHLAVRPGLTSIERQRALTALVGCVEDEAARRAAALIAWKDLAPSSLRQMQSFLSPRYHAINSLPVAVLDTNFVSVDAYLENLSSGTRRDVRRKLKKAQGIRVEHRTAIGEFAPRVEALYRSTQIHSEFRYGDFEELPQDYFSRVSENLGERTHFVFYWLGDELIAFNFLLCDGGRVIDKFLGMVYPQATDNNLYVRSWIENVRFCIAKGVRELQTGQTAYAMKVRLGSRLAPSVNLVRHRNAFLNWLVGKAAPFAAFDRWDPDLRDLRQRRRI